MPHVRRPKRFALLTLAFTCSISWLVIPQHPADRHSPPNKDAAAGPPETFSAPKAMGDSAEALPAARDELGKPRRAPVVESYDRLPLSFEANAGRFDERVKYVSRGSGYALFLTPTEAVLTLRPAAVPPLPNVAYAPATRGAEAAVLRMKCVGADLDVRPEGVDEQPGKSNYFIGNDPAKWHTNVASYGGVRYRRIYPGVDLVYHGNQRQLEYDFVVAPGAKPDVINLIFEGAREVRLDTMGDLILRMPQGGEVRQRRPAIYQEVDGRREEVAGGYVLKGEREVGFEIAGYDASRPLVIDPVLSYASYLGGSRRDEGNGIAVDSFGNAYVTGLTESADFPTVNSRPPGDGFQDVFVAKINAAGSAIVYSTYLGGSQTDQGFGVAVDSSGNAYVTGLTNSPDFPTTFSVSGTIGGTDAFVTKLSPEGSTLVYSTYLGGSGADTGYGIAVDSSGSAYVIGQTSSPNFPTANAVQPTFGGIHFGGDAFISKLNPAGTALVYSTFLGGSDYEDARSIAVDSSGSAYVTGTTHSTDFPTANAFQPKLSSFCSGGNGRISECLEAFVTKLSPAGSAFVYSTYLGGNLRDEGRGIAVDSAGNAYVTGETSSTNFPVTTGAFQPALSETHDGPFIPEGDAFVTKLNVAGSGLVYSTYLGGTRSTERVGGVSVNADGCAYVAGVTGSATFPVLDSLQPRPADGGAAFVTKMNPSGTGLVYSTYLGGNDYEVPNAIALDSAGNAYLTGWTFGGFPVLNPFQPTIGGGTDAFVAKIGNAPIQQPTVLAINTVTPGRGGNSGSVTVSLYGTGFKSGATVKLTRPGQPDINAAAVGVSEDFFIARARFDLVGHAPSLRDVVLTNPDGRSVTRAAAFSVEAGGRPQMWVDIIGRDEFRPGRPQTYYIAYGNRGNVDASLVPFSFAIPKAAEYQLEANLLKSPQPVAGETFDFSQIPLHYETGTEKIIPLFAPIIPAGASDFLRIRVTGGDQPLRLVARVIHFPKILFAASTSASKASTVGDLISLPSADGDPPVCFSGQGGCLSTIAAEAINCGLGFIPGDEPVTCPAARAKYQDDLVCNAITTTADAAREGGFTESGLLVSGTHAAVGAVKVGAACVGASPVAGQLISAVNCGFGEHAIEEACPGFGPFTWVAEKITIPLLSRDPNDKSGPAGVGAARYISSEEPLRYSINFENLEAANAAAQDVIITDQLNPSKLDFDTFSFGPVSFGRDKQFIPPMGLSEFRRDVDLRPAKNLIVRVEAKLDKAAGLLTWRFTSLDPATGQPTEDPTAGFLPPNKNAPEGEGQVLFTVRPKEGVATGTEIRNKARIVFDTNAPIDTPEWLNTIDYSKPESHGLPLVPRQNSSRFEVKWSGADTGSGVQSYTVFVSEDGGPFAEWLRDTAAQSAFFNGTPGKTYAFYTVARDATGNTEDAPASADSTTTTEPLVLRFSVQGYTAGEGDGQAVINVLRTGNTDAATVFYATGDGTASERSDYMAALGQLSFAVGESSKSFTVLITDDALAEGSETVSLTLTDPTGGATVGSPGAATLTITDNDAASSTVNPLGDARFFVRQHYLDFLNRLPDEAGLNFWVSQLGACDAQTDALAKGACLEDRRINVSAAFFLSIEFQQTAYFAFRFYRASFPDGPARPRGLPRLRELLRDSQEISRGVIVNQGDWQTTLENNRREFARRWVQRAEFVAQFPAALPAQQFVDGLFANSGVTPTQAEREEALAAYGGGRTEGRAQALRSVADSGSVYNKQYNPAFVLTQYFGYLRRNPSDPPDADFAGYDFWLSKLDQFSRPGEDVRDERVAINRARRSEMIKAFLVSVEYMTRFGPANFDIRH